MMEGPSLRRVGETDNGRRWYSVLERYHRLTHGRRPRMDQHRREAELTTTTRSLLDNLYSGDLPSPGVSLHLSSEAQRQLRSSGETEDADLAMGNGDDHSSVRDSDDELDLFIQNKDWLSGLPPTSLGPSDVRYPDAASDMSSDEEERLVEASPFQRCQRPSFIPPIREEVEMTEPEMEMAQDGPSTEDQLVELARDGRFSELWFALKMARKQKLEAGSLNGTLYYSAGDTFISEWTSYTSRRGMIVKEKNSYHTAMEVSVGSSFETCETLYGTDSDIDVYRQLSGEQEGSVYAERQQELRQLILARAKQREQERGRRRRIAVITRIPREPEATSHQTGRRQSNLKSSGAVAIIKRLRQALQVHRGVADAATVMV